MRYMIGVAVLLGVLIFLQYRVWFDAGGMKDLKNMKTTLHKQLQNNELQKAENQQLLAQIKNLKTNHEETEARARQELGMIKKDETFYQIVK